MCAGSAVQAGPVSIAMTRRRAAGHAAGCSTWRGSASARKTRASRGWSPDRRSPGSIRKTKAAFGFSQGAKAIERQLTGAEGRRLPDRPRHQRRSRLPGPARHQHGAAPRPRLRRADGGDRTGPGVAGRQDQRDRCALSLDQRFARPPLRRRTWASARAQPARREAHLARRPPRRSLFGGGGSSSLFLDLEARRDLGAGWSATLMAHGAAGPISPAAASRAGPMRFDLAKFGVLNGERPARPAPVAAAADRAAAGSR